MHTTHTHTHTHTGTHQLKTLPKTISSDGQHHLRTKSDTNPSFLRSLNASSLALSAERVSLFFPCKRKLHTFPYWITEYFANIPGYIRPPGPAACEKHAEKEGEVGDTFGREKEWNRARRTKMQNEEEEVKRRDTGGGGRRRRRKGEGGG